jgi:hypothetical protein
MPPSERSKSDVVVENASPGVNFINILTFYKQLLGQYSFAKKTQTQTVIKEKLC